jgi:hypothetical protein
MIDDTPRAGMRGKRDVGYPRPLTLDQRPADRW